MRVWIDLANSPHVAVFRPLVAELRARGWETLVTARDHAQTVALARRVWPDVRVVGAASPAGAAGKAKKLLARTVTLRRLARAWRPDVALSHGSYAQIAAAASARIPAVTMMDYEHQPANHLSFRLAARVLVPDVFPTEALRRFGARPRNVRRYAGYKEELYLADCRPDGGLAGELGIDPAAVLVAMRPPPEGALCHRHANRRFDEVLELVRGQDTAAIVLLPRDDAQAHRYARLEGVLVPPPVDGCALLLAADVMIGAGGTMNREAAVLGTPTYTIFEGRLAAVDAQLIREGRMHDLRAAGTVPELVKKPAGSTGVDPSRARAIAERVIAALEEVAP